ncbi:DNA primase [Bacteroides caecigallinarum]|uniref:DNA primase n=1 Tax=Bacteroides caecigallinarum TaxID=1411144 RepID=UPI001F2B2CB1|nr:DNA primase [Bacteroides caecigallinarum]MCF2581392.1 DNA primase [Bacteroides caecigallinarum]
MIDQATIDRILDAAQIVDVVSDFVTLRKRGVNYVGLCPFHNEKTPSFSVSPSKGVCKCFSCGKGGNAVHFIMEHEQLSYYEALKWLAKKYNIEIKERELTKEEKQSQGLRESLFLVNQFAAEYFQDILYNNVDGQSIGMTYFRQRGFRDDIIKKFQLGYCTEQKDALAKTAVQKGYKQELLLKTGLCYMKDDGRTIRDRFWGRVIFPVHNITGKVVAFGGRVLSAATKNVQMKYVNSPESEIYHKSKELYGIYFAKQSIIRQDRCFLVEGYTDVISMHQSGIENVVASSGTALTSDQIRLIHRFTSNITVLYDGDGAGIKASIRGIDMILEEGMNIKVCLLPDGEDPDSFARKHNATEYQAYINNNEVDFIRFKTNLLMDEAGKDPIKRAELISSIVKSISVIPDSIVRSVYIRECSQLLKMDEKILVEATAKLIEQAVENKEKEEERKRQREEYSRRQQAIATAQQVEQQTANNNSDSNDVANTVLPTNNLAIAPTDTPVLPPEGNIPPPELTPEVVSPVDTYSSYIPAQGNENKVFYKQEESLVKMIIRYGEKIVCCVEDEEGNEQPLTVTEYIAYNLRVDDIQFHNPVHRKILKEAEENVHNENFVAERYFLSNPDPEISKTAADMSSDRYQLSNYHSKGQKIITDEERLYELVPRLLLDFKISILKEEMKHTLQALNDPAVASNPEKSAEIMAHFKDLTETQNMILKDAGDRTTSLY